MGISATKRQAWIDHVAAWAASGHPYRRLNELLPFNWTPPTDSYTL